MLASKEEGGLGINSLELLNIALISKWVWRYKTEDQALWVKIIESIHGINNLTSGSQIKNKTIQWSNIIDKNVSIVQEGVDISRNITTTCGDGKKIAFWSDIWLDEKALKDTFPRLFRIDSDPDAQVADRLDQGTFTSRWRRPISQG